MFSGGALGRRRRGLPRRRRRSFQRREKKLEARAHRSARGDFMPYWYLAAERVTCFVARNLHPAEAIKGEAGWIWSVFIDGDTLAFCGSSNPHSSERSRRRCRNLVVTREKSNASSFARRNGFLPSVRAPESGLPVRRSWRSTTNLASPPYGAVAQGLRSGPPNCSEGIAGTPSWWRQTRYNLGAYWMVSLWGEEEHLRGGSNCRSLRKDPITGRWGDHFDGTREKRPERIPCAKSVVATDAKELPVLRRE